MKIWKKLWNYDIDRHCGEEKEQWKRWKNQYLDYNKNGDCVTFAVLDNDDPIGQLTLLLSPNCSAIKNKPMLCDGKNIANMNAFELKKNMNGKDIFLSL